MNGDGIKLKEDSKMATGLHFIDKRSAYDYKKRKAEEGIDVKIIEKPNSSFKSGYTFFAKITGPLKEETVSSFNKFLQQEEEIAEKRAKRYKLKESVAEPTKSYHVTTDDLEEDLILKTTKPVAPWDEKSIHGVSFSDSIEHALIGWDKLERDWQTIYVYTPKDSQKAYEVVTLESDKSKELKTTKDAPVTRVGIIRARIKPNDYDEDKDKDEDSSEIEWEWKE